MILQCLNMYLWDLFKTRCDWTLLYETRSAHPSVLQIVHNFQRINFIFVSILCRFVFIFITRNKVIEVVIKIVRHIFSRAICLFYTAEIYRLILSSIHALRFPGTVQVFNDCSINIILGNCTHLSSDMSQQCGFGLTDVEDIHLL